MAAPGGVAHKLHEGETVVQVVLRLNERLNGGVGAADGRDGVHHGGYALAFFQPPTGLSRPSVVVADDDHAALLGHQL
jgi:hypothetical protein